MRADVLPRVKSRALPPDWSAQHDARLREAGGLYAALRDLSDEWGISEVALLARWHRLRRDGSGPVLSPEARDFKALCERVTPLMARVLTALRGQGALRIHEIAERTGLKPGSIVSAVRGNADRIGPGLPWRLERIDAAGYQTCLALHHIDRGVS